MEGETAAMIQERQRKQMMRDRLRRLCECDDIVPVEAVQVVGDIVQVLREAEDNVPSSDELDEHLEEEYQDINKLLDLPDDTYSLTAIKPELPSCVKYGVRPGLTHINMDKFSPLSRGHQGGAVAIAAIATTTLYKSRCWNETVIDQIIDDGDTYYCESYAGIKTSDRRLLSIIELKRDVMIQRKISVRVNIEEASYAGKFRSQNPKELHLVKALELFFKRYNAGVLTSPVLNVAMWKEQRYFNVFDGQPRKGNCEPGADGTAKLFLLKDLMGVLFIILEKSSVENEPFVLHAIDICGAEPISQVQETDDPIKILGKPQRRPSGYKVQEKYRAVVHGTYHALHSSIPAMLRGRGNLVIAVAALIYSRLVNANKWTSALIDLIFNQSNIYLIDLVRVLEKKFDKDFDLTIDDVIGDVILGPYSAKIKVTINVVPGFGKKSKLTLEDGLRLFFSQVPTGVLELKKMYYAIWKEGDTYYFLDPYACDDEGFRSADFDNFEKLKTDPTVHACVTMNSSVVQLVETILENTASKDKDPFVIHGLKVLYVKTGTASGKPFDKVIYRERDINRRPEGPPVLVPVEGPGKPVDMTPRERPGLERMIPQWTQFPDPLKNVDDFMMKEGEPETFVVAPAAVPEETVQSVTPSRGEEIEAVEEEVEEQAEESTEAVAEEAVEDTVEETVQEVEEARKTEEEAPEDQPVKRIRGYAMVNPHRLVLQGTKNSFAEEYLSTTRGRQGLIAALTALAYRRLKEPELWRNVDVDQIIDVSTTSYEKVISWIKDGRPEEKKKEDEEEMVTEEAEEGEEASPPEEEEEEEEEIRERDVIAAPSHLDLTMLPITLKLGENLVVFKTKLNVSSGEAVPFVNVGDALERYFNRYPELILENKRLVYGIWKEDDKYFMFNPYGSDEEGWRLRNHPASFIVTGNLNELVDVLYGVFEFNDPAFSMHFVGLESIEPGKFVAPNPIVVPEDDQETFQTKFLPITDDDLYTPAEPEPDVVVDAPTTTDVPAVAEEEEGEGGEVADQEGEEEEEEEEEDITEELEAAREAERQRIMDEEAIRLAIDPLEEVAEIEQPDAPYHLNLSLLTGSVKIVDDSDKGQDDHEEVILEKLKYSHPPPYVLPPKRALCTLMESRRAKVSIHSLISRFSIDSRLEAKKTGGLGGNVAAQQKASAYVVTVTGQDSVPTRLIKLSKRKYLYSRLVLISMMPLRAINDRYIQDDDGQELTPDDIQEQWKEKKENMRLENIPEVPTGLTIKPEIIPLGPLIKTPAILKKPITCIEKKKRKCLYARGPDEDSLIEQIVCKTEDVLFELMFPNSKSDKRERKKQEKEQRRESLEEEKKRERELSTVKMVEPDPKVKEAPPEPVGFEIVANNMAVIRGNNSLKDRTTTEPCHFKSCYFSAMLCILAKIRKDVQEFSGSILDHLVFLGDKIYQRTGKLRFKPIRWFHNVEILDTIYTVIAKQMLYAEPETCEADELSNALEMFLEENSTGIVVFSNVSYAFWKANERYYMFDPYSCDEQGNSQEDGYACLMEFCDLPTMIAKMEQNTGETSQQPYRMYTLSIAHMEAKEAKKKKKKKKKLDCVEKNEDAERGTNVPGELPMVETDVESEVSLIELTEWVTEEPELEIVHDMTIAGFAPIQHHDASVLDVLVLENDITTPILNPFKKSVYSLNLNMLDLKTMNCLPRERPFDRKFTEHCAVATPIDLCIIAWSLIHDPALWSLKTVKGLFEASTDYAFDSILAAQDSTVDEMIDGLLPEFEIANYVFRAAFVPLHYGTLYAIEGWNLAMSLKRLFESPVYSGAIIVCGSAHIGVTKNKEHFYAWWMIRKTKSLRIITSEEMDEFLWLIVKEIDQPEEIILVMRIVTISYAHKLDPDCSDVRGLHEPVVPSVSLAQVHKMQAEPYNVEELFRCTRPTFNPIFIQGTVALRDRDSLKEPRVKRCYFVAVLAVMVKRDIIQSPLSAMIDKVLEVAENLYREFSEPKFHSEHILRNVTVMNRIFDFRDVAFPLVPLTVNPRTGRNDFFVEVRKHMRRYFKTYTSGIIQFANCCYGFWFSRSTKSYYYLDPYQCNAKGRKVSTDGKACLCIFSSVCAMVKNMCFNQFEDTTGFFIHRLHVNAINVPAVTTFQEDPMWIYLDYHWNFSHGPKIFKSGKLKKKQCDDPEHDKQFWNNYAIEVPNLIYSLWGTIGSYNLRFGGRSGKNQAAICVAVLAMQYLSHPSRWGPAILDSAVICGDSYYTESLKTAARKCIKHFNPYNLQTCFKVFPHVWTIDFIQSICGVLYGSRNKMTLTAALKLAFEDAPNLLVSCNNVTLGVLSNDDGFYVADPCWIGPPLFTKDRNALYVLRCKNTNSLIYAITKMFNTNQRLEFRVTPVRLSFDQDTIRSDTEKTVSTKRRILSEALDIKPAKASHFDPMKQALTVPDEDLYLRYCKNLAYGTNYGPQLENPQIVYPQPNWDQTTANSVMISTAWHLNTGQPQPSKKIRVPFDPELMRHVPEECITSAVEKYQPSHPARLSITDLFAICHDYPRTVDFMEEVGAPIRARKRDVHPVGAIPLSCLQTKNFIIDESRDEFERWNVDLTDKAQKEYRHRLPKIEVQGMGETSQSDAPSKVTIETSALAPTEEEETEVAETTAGETDEDQ